MDATGHRWMAQLANYQFDLQYRSGKSNIDADSLSRITWPEDADVDKSVNTIPCQSVVAILQGSHLSNPLFQYVCCHAQIIPNLLGTEVEITD